MGEFVSKILQLLYKNWAEIVQVHRQHLGGSGGDAWAQDLETAIKSTKTDRFYGRPNKFCA